MSKREANWTQSLLRSIRMCHIISST
jgi:hypothetical protein